MGFHNIDTCRCIVCISRERERTTFNLHTVLRHTPLTGKCITSVLIQGHSHGPFTNTIPSANLYSEARIPNISFLVKVLKLYNI